MSSVCPGLTFPVNGWAAGPLIELPLENTAAYDGVQEQVPLFFSRQVLVKASFGAMIVPSGIVTSVMNWAALQLTVVVAGADVGGTLVGTEIVGAGGVFVGGTIRLVAV